MLDLLLNSKRENFKRDTQEVEIPRLSKMFGEPFLLKCHSLNILEYQEVQEEVDIDKDGNISTGDVHLMTVLKSVPQLSEPQLMKHFGVPTPKELVNLILKPGEVSTLANIILELSGFEDNNVVAQTEKEVKN